jgi:phage tail-like protein
MVGNFIGLGQTITGARLDAISNFRFHVTVDDIWFASFNELTLPTLTVDTGSPIIEGGQNTYKHKLPYRIDVGTVSLKHGLTWNMHLMTWYFDMLDFNANPVWAKRTVLINIFNVARLPLTTIILSEAYPIKYTGPALKSDGTEVSVEQIELAFSEFTAY